MEHRHRRALAVTALALGSSALGTSAAAQTAPAPAATAQTTPAPRPRSPWRFVTSFAIQDISGNKQLRVLQSSIRIERQTPDRLVLAFRLDGGYGKSGGSSELERRLSSSLRFDWTPRAST